MAKWKTVKEYNVGRKKFRTKTAAVNYARKKGAKRVGVTTYEIKPRKGKVKVYGPGY